MSYDTVIVNNIFAIDGCSTDREVITLLNVLSGHYSCTVKKASAVKLAYIFTKMRWEDRKTYIEAILSRYMSTEDDVESSCYRYIISRLPIYEESFKCQKVRSVIIEIKRSYHSREETCGNIL